MSGALLVLAPLRIEQLALAGTPGVEVRHTGMGPARARLAAAAARGSDARALAVAGFCAAIAPELGPGDVVCASELLCDDGPPLGLPEGIAMAAALERHGLRVQLGPLVSSARLEAPEERRRRAGSALALDMESAWLAAAAAGRPLAVVRVVVDAAGRRLADPRIALAGLQALRSLRRTRAALAEWAAAAAAERPSGAGRGAAPPEPAQIVHNGLVAAEPALPVPAEQPPRGLAQA